MAKKNKLSIKEFQIKETKYFDALDLLRYNKPKKPSRKQAQQAMKTIKTIGPQINRNAKKLWSTLEKKHKLNIQPIDVQPTAPKKKTTKKKQTTKQPHHTKKSDVEKKREKRTQFIKWKAYNSVGFSKGTKYANGTAVMKGEKGFFDKYMEASDEYSPVVFRPDKNALTVYIRGYKYKQQYLLELASERDQKKYFDNEGKPTKEALKTNISLPMRILANKRENALAIEGKDRNQEYLVFPVRSGSLYDAEFRPIKAREQAQQAMKTTKQPPHTKKSDVEKKKETKLQYYTRLMESKKQKLDTYPKLAKLPFDELDERYKSYSGGGREPYKVWDEWFAHKKDKELYEKYVEKVNALSKPSPKKKTTSLYTPFQTSKHGKSRSRKARERLTFTDPYEKQMASRLQKKTGMTYLQIANLVKEAKKSDYIDIETEISSVAGESTQKTELYEAAMKRIKKKTKREKTYTEYSGDELSDLEEMYAMQAEDYYNR